MSAAGSLLFCDGEGGPTARSRSAEGGCRGRGKGPRLLLLLDAHPPSQLPGKKKARLRRWPEIQPPQKQSESDCQTDRRHLLARTPGGMATAQELFGAEAGAAPGLECWRIEAMKPVPNADALKGRFCEGGC